MQEFSKIAQVLLMLPTSFAQLGYASGVALQVVYGIMSCWACYMITWLYMEYRKQMERQGHTFETHVIQDRLLSRKSKYVGLAFNCVYLFFAAITQLIACGSVVAITYTSWYMTVGALFYGSVLDSHLNPVSADEQVKAVVEDIAF